MAVAKLFTISSSRQGSFSPTPAVLGDPPGDDGCGEPSLRQHAIHTAKCQCFAQLGFDRGLDTGDDDHVGRKSIG